MNKMPEWASGPEWKGWRPEGDGMSNLISVTTYMCGLPCSSRIKAHIAPMGDGFGLSFDAPKMNEVSSRTTYMEPTANDALDLAQAIDQGLIPP